MVKKRGKHIPQLFDPFPRTPEGHLAGRSGADQVPIFLGLTVVMSCYIYT